MNKTVVCALSLIVFAVIPSWGFVSEDVVQVLCSVSFGYDRQAPTITHVPVTYVSSVAVVSGTADDDRALATVQVYYYYQLEPATSSVSVAISSGVTNYAFSFDIRVNPELGSLYYQIQVIDAADNASVWPGVGVYRRVDVAPPAIVHEGLERVSPIAKIASIVGSVTDDDSLRDVAVYYKTDKDVYFSSTSVKQVSGKDADFSFIIPITAEDPGYFYYQIAAGDAGNNYSFWPTSGQVANAVQFNSIPLSNTLLRASSSSYDYWARESAFLSVSMSANHAATMGADGGTIVVPDGNPLDGETSIESVKRAYSHNDHGAFTDQRVSAARECPITCPAGHVSAAVFTTRTGV